VGLEQQLDDGGGLVVSHGEMQEVGSTIGHEERSGVGAFVDEPLDRGIVLLARAHSERQWRPALVVAQLELLGRYPMLEGLGIVERAAHQREDHSLGGAQRRELIGETTSVRDIERRAAVHVRVHRVRAGTEKHASRFGQSSRKALEESRLSILVGTTRCVESQRMGCDDASDAV